MLGRMYSRLTVKLGALFTGGRHQDISDEVQAHIEQLEDLYRSEGMSAADARQKARRKFGNGTAIRETSRDLFVFGFLDSVVRDARVAIRGLARTPGFTITAILTLTLAIGAGTAAFSVVDGTLLSPLNYEDPEELLWISRTRETPFRMSGGSLTLPTLVKFREQITTLEAFAALANNRANLVSDGPPELIQYMHVTQGYFQMLGVVPALGEALSSEEMLPDGTAPAMITYGEWQSRWGGSPDVLGRTFRLEEAPLMTIVGVLPEGFRELPRDEAPAPVWTIPFEHHFASYSGVFSTYGRPAEGETIESVRAELETINARLAAAEPEVEGEQGIRVEPIMEVVLSTTRSRAVWIFGAAVSAVFLIGVLNIVNLQVTRLARNEQELSIRAALGASRWAMARRAFVEATIVSGTAAVLAVGLLFIARDAVITRIPAVFPRMDRIEIDLATLGFGVLIAFISAAMIAFVPALRSWRSDVVRTLNEGRPGSTESRRQHGLRGMLTMVETGAAVVLLVVAGLLIHSFDRLMSKDLGFEPGNVLTVRVALPNRYADEAAFESFFQTALERIQSLPGVEQAAVSNGLPLEGGASTGVRGEFGPEPWTSATVQDVSADYAEVIGIPVLAGRWVTEEEVESSAPVAVVSESVAMALWPGESPFGKRIGRFAPEGQEQNWRTVVGLTTDVSMNMSQGPLAVVYSPFTVSWFGASTYMGHSMIFGVRTSSSGTGTAIRDVVLDLEPDSAVTVRTYDNIIGEYVATTRFRRSMLVAFAGVAIGLAMLGIYSVAAFSVTSRVREMGLRMALGAAPSRIVRDMTRQGIQFPVLGLTIGLWLSTHVVRSISSFFSGMEPADSWAYLAVLVVGTVLVVVASWLPARRAAKVNPIVALRYE